MQYFQIPKDLAQLSVTLNLVSFGVFVLLGGHFSDRYGIRNTVLISLLVFLFGSILCLYSFHYYEFILGRCMQGAGIAAPSILGYVIVRDDHCRQVQPGKFAYLNGTYTLAMAISMLVGEYITTRFGWKENFLILLLLSGIIFTLCLYVFSSQAMPFKRNRNLNHFLLPASRKLWIFILAMGIITTPYWVFIGLSSKIYIDIMKVNIEAYSFYQGAIATSFAIFCFMSGKIIKFWGEENSFRLSLLICFFSSVSLGFLGILQIRSPLIYTLTLLCFAGSIALPLNVLYAETLSIFPEFAGRVASITRCLRLILTALVSEVIISVFKGELAYISIILFFVCMTFFSMVYVLMSRRWMVFGYLPQESSSIV